MSDQPYWNPNLERQIPGLRQALSNLSEITSRNGFHVATIVLAPSERGEGAAPSTRIEFSSPLRLSEAPSSLAQETRWVSEQREVTQLPTLPESSSIVEPEPSLPVRTRRNSKRASTSIIDEEKDTSTQAGKRSRLSDPSRAGTSARPYGSFWGTVLERRSAAPQTHFPAQRRRMSALGTMSPSQRYPTGLNHPPPLVDVPRVTPMQGIVGGQQRDERLHRTATLPALRIRSGQEGQHALPSIQEPAVDIPGLSFRERLASNTGRHSRHPSERRFFRSATQFLGRFSPFGGGQSAPRTTLQTAGPHAHLRSSHLTRTSTVPGLREGVQPVGADIFMQPSTGDTLHSQVLPTMRPGPEQLSLFQSQQGANVTPLSGSRSPSGSGVSYAQPSRTTSSPLPEGGRTQSQTGTRGRRGRRAGTSSDREQLFACELCDSKFRRKSDKNRHVRVVHEKSRPFVCPVCEKTFGEKSNMLKHRASVHDDVRTFRCPYCDQSFSQRGLCDTHVKVVHDKKQAKYFCEHCGLPFSRKILLTEHYQQVHPEYVATYGAQYLGGAATAATTTMASRRDVGGPSGHRPEGRAYVGDTLQHEVASQIRQQQPREGVRSPYPPVSGFEQTDDRRNFQRDSSG